MIKAAFINEYGEVSHIIQPSDDEAFSDGQVVDGYTIKLLDWSVNDITFHTEKYWDGEWKDKPEQPSVNHIWTGSWVLNVTALWIAIRKIRQIKLASSDWTQFNDSPLSDAKKTAWATYRAALREVPLTNANVTSVEDVTWPTKPGE